MCSGSNLILFRFQLNTSKAQSLSETRLETSLSSHSLSKAVAVEKLSCAGEEVFESLGRQE